MITFSQNNGLKDMSTDNIIDLLNSLNDISNEIILKTFTDTYLIMLTLNINLKIYDIEIKLLNDPTLLDISVSHSNDITFDNIIELFNLYDSVWNVNIKENEE